MKNKSTPHFQNLSEPRKTFFLIAWLIPVDRERFIKLNFKLEEKYSFEIELKIIIFYQKD